MNIRNFLKKSNLLKSVYRTIRNAYTDVTSSRSYRRFVQKKSLFYRWGDDFFCRNKSDLDSLNQKYPEGHYWAKKESYSIKNWEPTYWESRRKMVFEDFLPLLKNKEATVIDIGCGSGEWSVQIAPFCRQVDGYDYSAEEIKTAVKSYGGGYKNLMFSSADIREIPYHSQYDGAMILGVLMYMDSEGIRVVLEQLHKNMRNGGIVLVNDSLNEEGEPALYIFNRKTRYTAQYYSREVFCNLFEQAGFILEKEVNMDSDWNKKIKIIRKGFIFRCKK